MLHLYFLLFFVPCCLSVHAFFPTFLPSLVTSLLSLFVRSSSIFLLSSLSFSFSFSLPSSVISPDAFCFLLFPTPFRFSNISLLFFTCYVYSIFPLFYSFFNTALFLPVCYALSCHLLHYLICYCSFFLPHSYLHLPLFFLFFAFSCATPSCLTIVLVYFFPLISLFSLLSSPLPCCLVIFFVFCYSSFLSRFDNSSSRRFPLAFIFASFCCVFYASLCRFSFEFYVCLFCVTMLLVVISWLFFSLLLCLSPLFLFAFLFSPSFYFHIFFSLFFLLSFSPSFSIMSLFVSFSPCCFLFFSFLVHSSRFVLCLASVSYSGLCVSDISSSCVAFHVLLRSSVIFFFPSLSSYFSRFFLSTFTSCFALPSSLYCIFLFFIVSFGLLAFLIFFSAFVTTFL